MWLSPMTMASWLCVASTPRTCSRQASPGKRARPTCASGTRRANSASTCITCVNVSPRKGSRTSRRTNAVETGAFGGGDGRRPGRSMVIIDCHGHYTTAPAPHERFREAQLARLESPGLPEPPLPNISDDAIRESVENNQLRLLRERGGDMTIFSPKASGMQHHVRDQDTAVTWARACNDLIHRVVQLFPEHFVGVCQLPQTADDPIGSSVVELERCVNDLGFVGCNLNPDPSGGYWTSKPITDKRWYPLYETMVELAVTAMIHVSPCCNPHF